MNKCWSLLAAVGVVLVGFGAMGCGEDDDLTGTETGAIQPDPSVVAFPLVEIGETEYQALRLRNISDSEALRIFDVELVAGEDGHIDQLELIDAPQDEAEIDPGDNLTMYVEYTPTADSPTNRGEIRVRNSDPSYEEEPLVVNVRTLGNQPEFFPEPSVVRFQRRQPEDEAVSQNLRIINVGSGPLTIYEAPQYSGGEDFRIEVPERDFPVSLEPFNVVEAQENPEEYRLDVDVIYRPLGDGADTGTIHVESNDVDAAAAAEGERANHTIDVLADADAPCLEVDGRTVDFGQIPVGESGREQVTVHNCGTQDLEIDSIFIDDDEHGVFDVDLGSWDQNADGTLDDTVVLAPDETDRFDVEFLATEEGTRRADLFITSNDPVQPSLELDLIARGAEGTCPEAIATARIEGTPMEPSSSITVAPLEQVVLDGTDSWDEDGDVVQWDWQVLETPPGINVDLDPLGGADGDPGLRQFEPAAAGTYRIGLHVVDESGFQSCNRADVEVTVIPDQNIHIELTWTNPADPDETNDDGSDVDLHLVKMGPGTWFDTTWSIFYLHPNQDESPVWDPEDPSLDIDVRDGLGPENITMSTPDHCQWYGVGVHYFDEQFGTAYATVRIYINGGLRYERPYFPLEESGEFWDAARIHWDDDVSDATIVGVDGFYPLAPDGDEPAVTDDMINTGLCTAEGLY